MPCRISDFEIWPCGVSEATFKEEALFSEVEAEAPVVELLPEALFSKLKFLEVASTFVESLVPTLFFEKVSLIEIFLSSKGLYAKLTE